MQNGQSPYYLLYQYVLENPSDYKGLKNDIGIHLVLAPNIYAT